MIFGWTLVSLVSSYVNLPLDPTFDSSSFFSAAAGVVPGVVRFDHQLETSATSSSWFTTILQAGCLFVRFNLVVKLLSTTPMWLLS